MFFYLSKLLTFVLSPLIWVFILLIWSWRTKIETRKKKMFIAALCTLWFFSNSFFADEFMRSWEYTSEDLEKTEKFEYAIVLGGMSSYDPRLDKPQFSGSADRLWQTLVLLKTGQVDKMIITGGSGSILRPEDKEAGILKKYLLKIGIPDSCIIIENESKNTHENAVNTKKILDSLQIKSKVLFVTSAFHMRRGLGCFEKVGVTNLRPYCTDRFSGPRKFEFDHLFIPSIEAMSEFSLVIHEITGYLVYKVKGYC
ncbi:MAG TPA: YdcF family protein [Bacteroidia bacterium]